MIRIHTPLFVCSQNSEVQLLQLDPSGSDVWRLDPIVELIQAGAVGIIPTDTVYVSLIPRILFCLIAPWASSSDAMKNQSGDPRC